MDHLFGVPHDPAMTQADVFGGKWYEVDQDAGYGWKTYAEFLSHADGCLKDPSGFNKAVRAMPTANVRRVGLGIAVLLSLSPQWYNAYRVAGHEAAKHRETFLSHIAAAGVHPWVEIEGAGEATFGAEITYFHRPDGHTVLFLCQNPETVGTEAGGGNAVSLKTGPIPVTLKFAQPVHGVRDERRGAELGDGTRFYFEWSRNEAVVLSFDA